MAADVNSLVVSTLHKHGNVVHDQVSNALIWYWWLKNNKRVKAVGGGRNIVEPLLIADNDSVAFRDGKDETPITEQDPLAHVSWAWKTVTGAVPLFDFDAMKNMGEQEIIDEARVLLESLQSTVVNVLGRAFYDAGGNNALDGMEAICDNNNTYPVLDDKTDTAIGGINRATAGNEYWQAQCFETDEPFSVNSGADGGMDACYDACIQGKGNGEPDLILMSHAHYAAYKATLLEAQRHESAKLAEAGFRNLMYNGAACVWDRDIDDYVSGGTEISYFLNTRFIKIRPHTKCTDRFIVKGRHPMEGYFADRVLVAWMGNITCTMPRCQGAMRNKSV